MCCIKKRLLGLHERVFIVKELVNMNSTRQEKTPYMFFPTLWGCVVGFTLLLLVIVDKKMGFHVAPNPLPIANLQLIAVPLVLLFSFLFFLASAPAPQTSAARFYKQISCYFAIVLLCQMILARSIWFDTGWDVSAIRLAAKDMVSDGIEPALKKHAWYFSRYPNNTFLLLFTALLTKIGTVIWPGYPYRVVTLVNVVFVWLSMYGASLCTYRLTQSRRITMFAALLGTILICFSGFIVIPYSDTMAMPFPVLSLTCILFCKNKYIKTALVAFFSALGGLLKPPVLIVLIAYGTLCLCDLIKMRSRRQQMVREALLTACITALALLCVSGPYALLKKQLSLDTYFRADNALTMTHFLMMGANERTDGTYSEEDVTFSCSFPDVKTREQENLREYVRRLQSLGVSGTLSLLTRKHILSYNNGSFLWGGEGGFYQTANDRTDPFSVFLQEMYYGNLNDPKSIRLLAVQQIIWLTILLGIAGLPFYRGTNCAAVSWMSLTLLGVTLYLLLFECRSRYLFVFTPLFICLFGAGIMGWFRVKSQLANRLKKQNPSEV